MTATWTTPKTWNTGDPLTASDMNTHIRDNLQWIKDPPMGGYKLNEGADLTTTSTSFVNVEGTAGKFNQTITTSGGKVLVFFSGMVTNNTLARASYFDVEVDGVRYGGDDGLIAFQQAVAGYYTNVAFAIVVEGLSAGSHTFKLQWKVSSASTLTMYAGAGTANGDVHPIFYVMEVP